MVTTSQILLSLVAAYGAHLSSAFAPTFNQRHHGKTFTNGGRIAPAVAPLSMVAVDTSDIKNGLTVEINGDPHKVLSFSVMKQARGAAKTTIKFKNLVRGSTIENTYRSGEKFETAMVEKRKAQYTYKEGETYFFMDSETFDTIPVPAQVVDEKEDLIFEGMEITLVEFKNSVIEAQLPVSFVYEIIETEPNAKGNTASGHTKPAIISSGATITVPGYLNQGDMIKVDTENRSFSERAK